MQVNRIDNIHQFDQLKTGWETVYAADPHAHLFVSWMRLRGWFEITPYDWFVLAVRPDNESPYVAFLPLIMRAPQTYTFSPIRVLHMGGWPLAEYTGFICSPEYEKTALAALALYIQQQLGWDSFQLEYFLDPRLDFFLECFPQKGFNIQQLDHIPCLSIPLPATWEQYSRDFMGKRKTLKRKMKQIERCDELCITYSQEDSAL